MPELPEVETVKQALIPILQNHKVLSTFVGRRNLRWPLPENLTKRLTNRVFTHLTRRGKYVLMHLDSGEVLMLHLGMSGSVRIYQQKPTLGQHDHFMMEVAPQEGSGNCSYVVLNDPRRFGWIDLFAASSILTHKLLADMGVEPLSNKFSAAQLEAAFKGRSVLLKTHY